MLVGQRGRQTSAALSASATNFPRFYLSKLSKKLLGVWGGRNSFIYLVYLRLFLQSFRKLTGNFIRKVTPNVFSGLESLQDL